MDIRVINSKREIINVSNLSIKRVNSALIGVNERNEVILIEDFGEQEEAKRRLEAIGEIIIAANEAKESSIVIVNNLIGGEEDGE